MVHDHHLEGIVFTADQNKPDMISKLVLRLFGSKFWTSWRRGRDQGFWAQNGKSKTNLLRLFCSQERQILEALQQRLETRKPGHWQKRLRCGGWVDAGYMVIPLGLHPLVPAHWEGLCFFCCESKSNFNQSLVNRNASSSHGSPKLLMSTMITVLWLAEKIHQMSFETPRKELIGTC